jgi:hypothetical protein
MLKRVILLVLCVLGFASRAAAQTPPADTLTDERLWTTFVLQRRADAPGPWRWSLETIVRTRDGVQTIDNAALRPIVNFNVDKHSTIGGGYAYVVYSPATIALAEHRWFQQYIWNSKIAGGSLQVRERLEERFLEGNSGMAGRLRNLVRYSHAIKTGSRFSAIGYDELFLHLNDTTVTRQGVDQNRIFGGIGEALSKRYRYEVGYLNQYLPGHDVVRDRMNHVLSGNFAISF